MSYYNRKLNILITCFSNSWGGLEMATIETAIQLKKTGQNVTIAGVANSFLTKQACKNGFQVLAMKSGNIAVLYNIYNLVKYLKSCKPDIIHSNLSHDLWTLTPAVNFSGSKAKLLLTKHMASGVKKTDFLHRYLYQRIDKAIAVSEYIKKSLIETTSLLKENIIVIPVGIVKDKFTKSNYNAAEIKKSLQLPQDKLVIGFTGRITPGKGHEDFFNAAKILNEKFPDKLFYLIVGSSGKGEEYYEEKIKLLPAKLGIDNYRFAGFTDEPQKFMSVFDVLAFPSHDESFGRVLVEAMALGTPAASSGYAGVLDITIDNETGLLFEPKNPESMADSLSKLISDKNLREKFSVNGIKRFEEHFTIEKVTEKLLNLYLN